MCAPSFDRTNQVFLSVLICLDGACCVYDDEIRKQSTLSVRESCCQKLLLLLGTRLFTFGFHCIIQIMLLMSLVFIQNLQLDCETVIPCYVAHVCVCQLLVNLKLEAMCFIVLSLFNQCECQIEDRHTIALIRRMSESTRCECWTKLSDINYWCVSHILKFHGPRIPYRDTDTSITIREFWCFSFIFCIRSYVSAFSIWSTFSRESKIEPKLWMFYFWKASYFS